MSRAPATAIYQAPDPNKPHIIGGATSRTMRAHWAAIELALDYSYELIGSRTGATLTPEFLALNPKHKIPILLHQDQVLTESTAIMNYLARLTSQEKNANRTSLLPEDVASWALYDEWQSFILMELDAQCLYVMRKHGDLSAIYGEAPGAMKTAANGFEEQIKIVEAQLSLRKGDGDGDGNGDGSGAWLLGDTFYGVDILLTTCLEWALSYNFDLSGDLRDYLSRVRAREAYQKARDLNFSIQPGA